MLTIEKTHPSVVTIAEDEISVGWERWVLLSTDRHHDNEFCDHDLERKHLEEVKERGGLVVDGGDLFCAMQGKGDARSDQDQLRPELRGNNYTDRLVDYAAEFYAPYAPHFAVLSPGNHEDSVLDRQGTNLTERLAERLRAAGSPVQVGRYQGWVRFHFTFHQTKRQTVRLRYTHGYGGGGPVTRDVIQSNRQAAYLGNADIVVAGHVHYAWEVPIRREDLNDLGVPVLRDQEHLRCGGYKDEYTPGQGYAVRKGQPPRTLGAYWLRFYLGAGRGRIEWDLIRAK